MAIETAPIVVKFGGEIVLNENLFKNLITSVRSLYDSGEKVILVHGGGPIATELSKKLNIEPQMVGGRRITCKDTLDVMKMTLSGIVNSNVLAALKAVCVPAVAASGISFIDAVTRPPRAVSGSDGELINFGYVGDINSVDPNYLKHTLEGGFLPVVSPLCAEDDGKILNINADTVSVQIAKYTQAKKLMLVTAVGGVFKDIDDPSSKFSELSIDQAKKLITEKVIQGGMIPKLEEGFKLLAQDLESFHIVGVDHPNEILQEAQSPGSRGTAIIK